MLSDGHAALQQHSRLFHGKYTPTKETAQAMLSSLFLRIRAFHTKANALSRKYQFQKLRWYASFNPTSK